MKKSSRLLLLLLLAAISLAAFATIGAGAESADGEPGIDAPAYDDGEPGGSSDIPDVPDVPDDPEPTAYSPEPIATHAPVETVVPYSPVEPDTEYVAPVTYYEPAETEYVAPVTAYVEPIQNEQYGTEYIALYGDAEPTGFIAPAMDKSVSQKTYSTDYTAGIVSWICVGVGVVVVTAVLVSTKLGGRSSYRQ